MNGTWIDRDPFKILTTVFNGAQIEDDQFVSGLHCPFTCHKQQDQGTKEHTALSLWESWQGKIRPTNFQHVPCHHSDRQDFFLYNV